LSRPGWPRATAKVVHAETQLFTAWYVLATIGLYQVVPGSSAWDLSTPLARDRVSDEDLREGRSLTFVTTTISSVTGWASAESDEPPVVG
jgi:hypothetical protein